MMDAMRKDMADKLDALGWYQVHPGHHAPDDFIDRIEAETGCILPQDYRHFLSRFPCDSGPGKAVLSPPLLTSKTDDPPSLLLAFGYQPEGAGLITLNRDKDIAIPGMMIIGDDIFGNWFYMDLSQAPTPGSIWFLDRDAHAPGSREGLLQLGRSFADFILRLETDPDCERQPDSPRRSLMSRLAGMFR